MVKKKKQQNNKPRTDDALTRKQKRKEERINKKKRRAINPESRKHKIQEDDEEVAPQLIEIKEPDKKKKKTKKVSSKKNVKVDDPYAGLDPGTVAAMKRDDEEIAELEAKLGIGGNKKDKEKLNKEYAKLEGYGNDFGHFLDDLDGLVGRINDGGEYPSDIDDLEYDSDESDLAAARAKALIRMEAGGIHMENSEDESSEDEKLVPMKAPASEEDSFDASELDSNQLSSDEESEDDNDLRDEASDTKSYSSNDENDSSDESSESDVESTKDHDPTETYRPVEGQDLYGNITNQNKNQDEKPTKYIPPHLRKKMAEENNDNENSTVMQKVTIQDDPERKQNLLTIQRSLNNTLNRLSDNTLESVAKSIVGIYNSHPSQDVNDCYWKNITSACLLPHMVMSGLIPVYIACVTGVHFQTGDTVQLGGHILEKVISTLWVKIHEFRNGYGDNEEPIDENDNAFEINKETSNIMLLLCYMYNFSAIHCTIIYDVVRDLIQSFTEQDVELLLLILKHCGYQLRSDDPTALKEIVLLVQERALQNIDQKDEKIGHRSVASNSRVQYMLGAINDLKNNKKKKNDDVVGEKVSFYRRAIGRMKTSAGSKPGSSRSNDTCLRITLKDILEVDSKGRWWKVGASWVGNQFRHVDENPDDMNENSGHSSIEKRKDKKAKDDQDELLILAAKQRMNSDDRRAIFCIIMGSDDCEDAFEKLVKTGMLKGKSDRDVALVLLHCCGQEKTYNPYYAHLASRICEYQSKCAFTFKLTYFDVFKQFDDMKARKAANLAKLLVHLVAVENRMNMTVLKAIEISTDDMPDSAVIFLTIFFSNVFLSVFESPEQITDFFGRAIPDASTNMKQSENMADEMIEDEGEALRESLSVFLIKYLKPSPQNEKKSRFSKNLKAAIKACEADRFESMFMM